MSDFQTMVATIRARTRQDATRDNDIKRAICDSIAVHLREKLQWNQARMRLTLIAGTSTYDTIAGLPANLIAFHGHELSLYYAGNAEDRYRVDWVPRESIERMREDAPSITGEPDYWSYYESQLELYPTPDLSTHELRGPYFKDVGTPTYVYNGTTWAFLDPLSGGPIGNAYTSPWFNQRQGFPMITAHAEWQLWTQVLQPAGDEETRAMTRYVEALSAAQELAGDDIPGTRRNDPC